MVDYKKLYYRLFNAITDALETLCRGNVEQAKKTLICAQQDTEEMYISAGE